MPVCLAEPGGACPGSGLGRREAQVHVPSLDGREPERFEQLIRLPLPPKAASALERLVDTLRVEKSQFGGQPEGKQLQRPPQEFFASS